MIPLVDWISSIRGAAKLEPGGDLNFVNALYR